MNMDKMVGADFEKGLAQMKARAESSGQSSQVLHAFWRDS